MCTCHSGLVYMPFTTYMQVVCYHITKFGGPGAGTRGSIALLLAPADHSCSSDQCLYESPTHCRFITLTEAQLLNSCISCVSIPLKVPINDQAWPHAVLRDSTARQDSSCQVIIWWTNLLEDFQWWFKIEKPPAFLARRDTFMALILSPSKTQQKPGG